MNSEQDRLVAENEALRRRIVELEADAQCHRATLPSIDDAGAREQSEIRDLAGFPSENPSPVLRVAMDGNLLYVNEAGLRLLPEWHLRVGQAVPPMLLDVVDRALRDGTTQVLDLGHGERVYSFFVAPIVDAGYANLYGHDITERMWAEEALRDSDELFSLYVRRSPICTYIKTVTPKESRVLHANDSFQQMIGFSGSEMLGKTMAELFPAEFAAQITADDWAVVASGQVLEVDEDLNGRNYATIKFPIVQGDRTLLAGYTIDITERKRAKEVLQQAHNELEQRVVERTEELRCHQRSWRVQVSPESPVPRDHPGGFEAVLRPSRQRLKCAQGRSARGHGGHGYGESPRGGRVGVGLSVVSSVVVQKGRSSS